jgi:hypothetical protein
LYLDLVLLHLLDLLLEAYFFDLYHVDHLHLDLVLLQHLALLLHLFQQQSYHLYLHLVLHVDEVM